MKVTGSMIEKQKLMDIYQHENAFTCISKVIEGLFRGHIPEANTSQDSVKGYPPVSSMQFCTLDYIVLLNNMSTPLTIFGLYTKVSSPKPLKLLWWYCDI